MNRGSERSSFAKGQRDTLFMLAAPPSDMPVTGLGCKHKTYSGVYQNLLIVLSQR